jgi:SnoaL-like domain
MELIDEYLAALEVGDAERVLALFAPDGIVHSPLYGSVPARQFYPTLFADTAEAKLTLRRVFCDDREAVAFWFDFAWVLADGMPAPFTVVDIAELTEDGLIANLHIIYDTSPTAGTLNKPHETGSPENISG